MKPVCSYCKTAAELLRRFANTYHVVWRGASAKEVRRAKCVLQEACHQNVRRLRERGSTRGGNVEYCTLTSIMYVGAMA